jgi:hypothetical protein
VKYIDLIGGKPKEINVIGDEVPILESCREDQEIENPIDGGVLSVPILLRILDAKVNQNY